MVNHSPERMWKLKWPRVWKSGVVRIWIRVPRNHGTSWPSNHIRVVMSIREYGDKLKLFEFAHLIFTKRCHAYLRDQSTPLQQLFVSSSGFKFYSINSTKCYTKKVKKKIISTKLQAKILFFPFPFSYRFRLVYTD